MMLDEWNYFDMELFASMYLILNCFVAQLRYPFECKIPCSRPRESSFGDLLAYECSLSRDVQIYSYY